MFIFAQKIIAEICVSVLMVVGLLTGTNNFDTMTKYKRNVQLVKRYENTLETAVPQTDVYGILKNHLSTPSEDGKTKKAIVIGYDGCRADTLRFAEKKETSAILTVAETGSLVLSYCGGVNYPQLNRQMTSTAPGWCSMLTGEWANVHGVRNNGQPKSNDHLTLLTTLVEDGTIESSAFYVSWSGHFVDSDATYINEKAYIEEKGINASFVRAGDDNGTKKLVLEDIKKSDCSDFIFSIFEYCDHVGHDTGFNLGNDEYVNAFADAESTALEILSAIKARETYDTEDWMIIITSDHGGYDMLHGAMSIQERTTFLACNKPLGYEF